MSFRGRGPPRGGWCHGCRQVEEAHVADAARRKWWLQQPRETTAPRREPIALAASFCVETIKLGKGIETESGGVELSLWGGPTHSGKRDGA
ncbi:hypothetical protein E2562_017905 [Oryza meyeriana var. granulata]|uniref:Uncharacterized protein n=1 Tax=Oryza meyeriana var. granulata TaxID=110450 RepID=A0A6G1CQV3_9ORYZ|nr:hypothetical protein E2562_017905 [Oryza meyeriana var. granulata]